MATLAKFQPLPVDDDQLISLSSSVPAPFSSTDRAYILRASQPIPLNHPITPTSLPPDLSSPTQETEAQHLREALSRTDDESLTQDQDVMPSVTRVQLSVLTILNHLLSPSTSFTQRHAAVLDHSTSSSSHAPPSTFSSPTAALSSLVSNLRNSALNVEMIQVAPSNDDMALLPELSRYVDALAPALYDRDVQLAHALISLLANLNRLSTLGTSSPSAFEPSATWAHDVHAPSVGNLNMLARQLSEFQSLHHDHADSETPLPPVVAVERALLWCRVDENLEAVLSLCRQREEYGPRLSLSDPPQYDLLSHDAELPPDYDLGQESFMADTKSPATFSGRRSTDEKMRLELDAVTMAIDRLYRVAPQLHNQRVELKSSKLQELENARTVQAGQTSIGKQKERELERILDMIGRGSERKLVDQTVVLGDMEAHIDRARQRDNQKREEFVDRLAEHSGAGRIHAQDATFSSLQPKDPNALLTLPEFIRESVPRTFQRSSDPNAVLTLNEAAREYPNPPLTPGLPSVRSKSPKGTRNRSMSAPPLRWLLPASSKAHSTDRSIKGTSSRRSSSAGKNAPSQLDVSYVAEHHESLRHVLVFLNISGIIAGINLEASVVTRSDDTPNEPESALVMRSGTVESPALALPVRTRPGTQEVRVQGLHYEIKVATDEQHPSKSEPLPLLDAEQLRAAAPTSFICASCSLPLVHGARITRYDDLPSEHWEELVDAWMCHTDQKLNAQVARNAKGFWPQDGQALVGGSYILFDKSVTVSANLRLVERAKQGDGWRSVRCICGALSGRSQEQVTESGETMTLYRLTKFAIRPVSPSAAPCRIPLSAFIVEDMAELVRAHATYRFVILDEEEERPRILVWLFKPNMRLSYLAGKNYFLPERGTIQAAKVLYKILGPSVSHTELGSLLERYPGFPQAEQLMYPKDTCAQIAILLKESNVCYPEGMRSMTGLDVGWLIRA